MPLPEPNSEWPPKQFEQVYGDIAKWSAWWASSPEELSRVYGGTTDSTLERSWTAQGGLVGAVQRFFWGTKTAAGEQRTKLHVPLASEIASTSADLLFAQPPTVKVDGDGEDKVTQDRIDDLFDDSTGQQLHEAAEACAALGHAYLRVGWDRDVEPDGPLLSVVDADAALPHYRYGRLQSVTFVREWADNGTVLRHLESHEPGWIWHAVYLGDHRSLGRQVSLSDHAQTADLVDDEMIADDMRDGSGIPTGLDRLDVVGVKNARTRTWRHLPVARDLGRADISGIEQTLDALDDAWSSWMRDIRLGRSMIHVPSHMLDTNGPGREATFNLNREMYVGLNSPPDGALQLTETQFKIRFEEHAGTTRALADVCVDGAGYSRQTFGLDPSTSTQTATESWARQVKTQHTRNGKIRHWKPGLRNLTRLMLAVDRVQFNGQGNPDAPVIIKFADTVSESQVVRAQTAALLFNAEAASTQTRVEMVHNDWDEKQIAKEVALIEGRLDEQAEANQLPDQQMPMDAPDEPDENAQEDPKRQA